MVIFMTKSSTKSYLRYPLDALLGNRGNVRVSRALMLYGAPLSVTQIAQETGMTPQGVRLVLDNLVGHGVVEVMGQGRTQLYSQKRGHPWVAPLRGLFQLEQGLWTDLLKKLRALLEADSQVTAAWLYGSVARREDQPGSDLDLAVLLASKSDDGPVRTALETLENERHTPFSVICLTEEDLIAGNISPEWWRSVLREGQQLKGRSRPAFEQSPAATEPVTP